MNFTNYLFLPCLFVVFFVYFILPKKIQWIWLLLGSLLFFASWGIEHLPIVLVTVLIAWIGGLVLQAINGQIRWIRKLVLYLFVILLLAPLVCGKAQMILEKHFVLTLVSWQEQLKAFLLQLPGIGYWVSEVASQENMEAFSTITNLKWIMPLGISYYTMSLLGYLADVYWKKEKAEKNFCKLLLFAIYFPKIMEGPIAKHRTLSDSLCEGHSFDYDRVCRGLQRMLWGYFKKLVIADRLAIFVSTVMAQYNRMPGSELLLAAIFGAVQLYCDFSGCMDMALGMSQVLGITLEENFKRPFFSCSAAEFWRRWHITLGVWLKDYIYMPMVVSPGMLRIAGWIRRLFGKHEKAGKRAGKIFLTVIPLAVVWILTGLWHGTGWSYLVWGAYWGGLIILSTVFEPEARKVLKRLHIDGKSKGYQAFCRIRTFALFVIARIITMPNDLAASRVIFWRIFHVFGTWKMVDGNLFSLGLNRPNFLLAILLIYFLWRVSKKQEEGVVIRDWLASLPLPCRWVILIVGILAVLVFGVYGPGYNASSFVYMNY